MITSNIASAALNPAMALLPVHLLNLSPVKPEGSEKSRLEPVKRWRMAYPDLFEKRRIEGMKKSDLVRENLMRLHREKKLSGTSPHGRTRSCGRRWSTSLRRSGL